MDDENDALHESWAQQASQEHMVQARIRNAQAGSELVQKQPCHAVLAKVILAQDHLIQALTKPEQEHDRVKELRIAYEAGYRDGTS
jgi:hypothetical protein